MKLIIYGGDDLRPIDSRMGSDEYSYHFVIEAFYPVLSRIGEVHTIRHLDDVEPIRAACERDGHPCVILSFVPPHKTTLFMRVALVPVFAWEFETIPYEIWDGQPKHDWRMVLQQQGRAITLSSHSAAVVRATMGDGFPAVGVAPPVFDRMAALRERIGGRLPTPQTLELDAIVVDSAELALSPEMAIPPSPAVTIDASRGPIGAALSTQLPNEAAAIGRAGRLARWILRGTRSSTTTGQASSGLDSKVAPSLSAEKPAPPMHQSDSDRIAGSHHRSAKLRLDGVVFLALINPIDGRKNWDDIITGFTWGLRDASDATLVIKMVAAAPDHYWQSFFTQLRKQPRFGCRVVMIHGFLDDARMAQLLEASSWVVNASSGEGCALPLLEGMSVGRPAIAPDHTAMSDYVDPSNSLIVESHVEVTAFPHDGRAARRTMWHFPRWDSLRDAFAEGYRIAKHDPQRWLSMADRAMAAQEALCGDAIVERRLREFLGVPSRPPSLTGWGRDLANIPIAGESERDVLAR